MSKLEVSELFLYRHRFFIGYGLIAIGLIAVLVFAGVYAPGGLSFQETQSVIKSDSIDFGNLNSLAITNLPYHLLQKASLMLFGVSVFSIKLPSLILAFLAATGMILLLRRWFKPNIGILASLIAISTGQFIFFAQDGTPSILYLFWPVWLMLLAGTLIRQQKCKIWLIIAFYISASLSLYTPLSIYILIAIAGAVMLHPHLRYIIKHLPKLKLFGGIIIALLLVTPLAILIVDNPKLGLDLLGIPTYWPNLGANISILGSQFFGFAKPSGSTIMTPFFELGSMLLIGIGIYHVIITNFTSKSYVIILWAICLAPILLLNPNFSVAAYLPLVLLLASGLSLILSHWYGLFPRNPYARVGGLVPLFILVTALILSGAERYVGGYKFDPDIASNFSKDLKLIPKTTSILVVANNELPFYNIVSKYNKRFIPSNEPLGEQFLATRNAKKAYSGYTIVEIIASPHYDQGDRFYLYKKQ